MITHTEVRLHASRLCVFAHSSALPIKHPLPVLIMRSRSAKLDSCHIKFGCLQCYDHFWHADVYSSYSNRNQRSSNFI